MLEEPWEHDLLYTVMTNNNINLLWIPESWFLSQNFYVMMKYIIYNRRSEYSCLFIKIIFYR